MDFESLKDIFKKFAEKPENENLTARILRSTAAGAKAFAEATKKEFSHDFTTKFAKNFYDLIADEDLSEYISSVITSFDETEVKKVIDLLASKIKEPETAANIAKNIKSALEKNSPDEILKMRHQVYKSINLDMQTKALIELIILPQAKSTLKEMDNSSEEEIASQLIDLVDNIPANFIADQIANFTSSKTPEHISKKLNKFVSKFPSPKAVSDVTHGVVDSFIQHMDKITKITKSSEVTDIIKDLKTANDNIIRDTLKKDVTSKNTFGKKSGGFTIN